MQYNYVAVTRNGDQTKGNIEAKNVEAAKFMLQSSGLTPITVKAQSIFSQDINIGGEKKVTKRDL